MRKAVVLSSAACAAALFAAPSALAGGHTWRISEIFSTPDGQIQFIELRESLGGPSEFNLGPTMSVGTGHSISGTTLSGNTQDRHILIATQSFADLPGAPTPDFIIEPNEVPFFLQTGDTINHASWDSWTFGALPTDCVSSLHKGLPPAETVTVGLNSPTNYAGVTGSINACPSSCPADTNNSGAVDVDDLISVILSWGDCPPKGDCDADVNDSGTVDVDDLIAVILAWGPC